MLHGMPLLVARSWVLRRACLGAALTDETGTAEESDKAVKWWRAAASRGHGLANYTVGKLLADGVYVDERAKNCLSFSRNTH